MEAYEEDQQKYFEDEKQCTEHNIFLNTDQKVIFYDYSDEGKVLYLLEDEQ